MEPHGVWTTTTGLPPGECLVALVCLPAADAAPAAPAEPPPGYRPLSGPHLCHTPDPHRGCKYFLYVIHWLQVLSLMEADHSISIPDILELSVTSPTLPFLLWISDTRRR